MKNNIVIFLLGITFLFISITAFSQEKEISNSPITSKKETQLIENHNMIDLQDKKESLWKFEPPENGTTEWEMFWREFQSKLIEKDLNLSKWKEEIERYFNERPFTIHHLRLWDAIFNSPIDTESTEKLPYYAGIFTCLALLLEAKKMYPNPEALGLSSQYLLRITGTLKESQLNSIKEIIENQLSSRPIFLSELWERISVQEEPAEAPPQAVATKYEIIIYLCLALNTILDPSRFIKFIQMPEPMSSFYRQVKILLFDHGALNEHHIHSLESIFKSIPSTLHRITALIVPEGTGISATKFNLPPRTGTIVDIPLIPMSVQSSPFEFPVSILPQTAPEFSLQAIMQIIRSAQIVQFQLRPELLFRRNSLLFNANRRGYNSLRQTVNPELYFSNPDELLPNSAYLWFLNSDKALVMANDCLRMGHHFQMDTFLLLADLLSEGKDRTYTFHLDEGGMLIVQEAPVIRLPIDEGYPAVIALGPERRIPSQNIPEKNNIKGL